MKHLRLLNWVPFAAVIVLLSLPARPGQAADRARIEAFLVTTGFDVALDSIALSSASAPQMLGLDAEAFGQQWRDLAEEVFDTETMRSDALDILEKTLSEEALDHAVDFYASDLGQRLVVAENDSHLEDDDLKQEAGQAIVSELVRHGSGRLEWLKRMNRAIDSSGTALKALQEIQLRFLLAASAAGVIELDIDTEDLRALLQRNETELRNALQLSALAGAAFTYQAFSDAEVQSYTEALEEPLMQEVYELLNAVQYHIMADRFEHLAARMAGLQPTQDL
ncbi:DUF2059 domain-containing protein [Ruegeria sp. WL0004]|uniref:DUF2059 domain-containing protein n=1 Tax=Ruegeria marisflavi TaxID=2984152 RepID=A0ABT2WN19_9RHOB|nr:DUF2059 domain-containing protein [Ruegeria sp. WL0004]MCU9837068.1 DUF2059 domain-containing protein [Ruegeria sp. WL0004]